MSDGDQMDLPERIAMCAHPGGEELHIALKPGEPAPTTCFQDCDCTPVEFVRASTTRGAVSRIAELEAERQMVLDAVNLYGDETLHAALDAIGWPSTTSGGQ